LESNTKSQNTHSGCQEFRQPCSATTCGIGLFPLEPNTKSQNTHSGCHRAALLNSHVRPLGTHPALIVLVRNRASARALPVLNVHKLCQWGKSSKLDRSHSHTYRAGAAITADSDEFVSGG
jgi:hypothetical protein